MDDVCDNCDASKIQLFHPHSNLEPQFLRPPSLEASKCLGGNREAKSILPFSLHPSLRPGGMHGTIESAALVVYKSCRFEPTAGVCRYLSTPLKISASTPAHSAQPTQTMRNARSCGFQNTPASAERAEKIARGGHNPPSSWLAWIGIVPLWAWMGLIRERNYRWSGENWRKIGGDRG